jgi:hypothetical protein
MLAWIPRWDNLVAESVNLAHSIAVSEASTEVGVRPHAIASVVPNVVASATFVAICR